MIFCIYINMQCSLQKQTKFKLKFKYKLWIIFVFIIFVIVCALLFLNYVVNPVIIESSAAKTKSLSQQAVESSIYDIIKDTSIYDTLITITRDENGKIVMMSTNSLQINLLAREISKTAQNRLSEIGANGINVPLGSFTGMPIFVGRGPKINIKMLPIGNISCSFSSEFMSAGINQTNHRIYLTVLSSVNVILPTANQVIKTTTQIMICESIIVGEIPATYLNSTSLDDMMNLIP